MKFTTFGAFALGVGGVQAAYQGDIVQYWVDQTAFLVNGTIIGGLQSPPSAWAPAIVHGAILLAATKSSSQPLAFQQLAVSHAAHNSLSWLFHGTRNFNPTDAAIKAIIPSIGLAANSTSAAEAIKIGRDSARTAITARSDDGINNFVDYVFGPQVPGVYQVTPGGASVPDTPQARYVRLFAGVGDVDQFQVPDPPKPTDKGYEEYVLDVKKRGERNSTTRSRHDTETAYFWRESAPILWNRIANAVIGNSLATNVLASANFYAQLNYALANAGIAGWNIKYKYSNWRPVTAIRTTSIYLSTGHNISSPTWTPLLVTPSHPDYVSTHATFGGAAAQVIRSYIGSDKIDVTVSSNVTVDNVGVLTRRYTNLTETVDENGESRVWGGIHFSFAKTAGVKLGTEVAAATLKRFDRDWDRF